MPTNYWDIIAHDLTEDEKAVASRVVIAASAPSADSAYLGAVRLIQMLKKAGVEIPADLGKERITTLEDWTLGICGDKAIVLGTVTQSTDERFPEGVVMQTSQLKSRARLLKAGDIVTTLNSRYRLGRRAKTVPDKHRQMARFGGFSIARVKA